MADMTDYGFVENDSDSETSGIYFSSSKNETIKPLSNESEDGTPVASEDEQSHDNVMKRSPYYLRSSRSRSNSPELNTSSMLTQEERSLRRQTILPTEAEHYFPKIQLDTSSKERRMQDLKRKYDEFSLPAIEETENEEVLNEKDLQNSSLDSSLPHSETNDPYVLNINVHIPREFSDKDIPLHVNIIKDPPIFSTNDTLHDYSNTTMESNTSSVAYGENSTSIVSADYNKEDEEQVGDEGVNREFVKHESSIFSPKPSTSAQQHEPNMHPSTCHIERHNQPDQDGCNPDQTSMEQQKQIDEVPSVDNLPKGKKNVTRKTKPKELKKETETGNEDKPKRKATRKTKKTTKNEELDIPEQYGVKIEEDMLEQPLPEQALEQPFPEQHGVQIEGDMLEQPLPEQALEQPFPEQHGVQIEEDIHAQQSSDGLAVQSHSGEPLQKTPQQSLHEQSVNEATQTQSLKDDLLELEKIKKENKLREKKEREERERKLKEEMARKNLKRSFRKKQLNKRHKQLRHHCHCCSGSSSSDSSDSESSGCDCQDCAKCSCCSSSSSSSSCQCGSCSSSSYSD